LWKAFVQNRSFVHAYLKVVNITAKHIPHLSCPTSQSPPPTEILHPNSNETAPIQSPLGPAGYLGTIRLERSRMPHQK
jgi:hypothetical protein